MNPESITKNTIVTIARNAIYGLNKSVVTKIANTVERDHLSLGVNND